MVSAFRGVAKLLLRGLESGGTPPAPEIRLPAFKPATHCVDGIPVEAKEWREVVAASLDRQDLLQELAEDWSKLVDEG